jgi:hypothetical protein
LRQFCALAPLFQKTPHRIVARRFHVPAH